MKVLLINNRHFLGGGADVVYFTTGELLQNAGHGVVFFSKHSSKAEPYCLDSFFAPDLEQYNFVKRTLMYFNNHDAADALDRLLSIEKIDIAHVHLIWGGLTASIIPVLHRHNVPIVHTAHDYRMICPAYTFRNGQGDICELCKGGHFMQCFKHHCSKGKKLESFIMAREMIYRNRKWHPAYNLDGIIYVSRFAKEKHEDIDSLFVRTRNTVLYNFTTIGEKYPPTEENGGYYLYYGRLSYEKGIVTLLNAFSKFPHLKLKIVGTGPQEFELRKMGGENVDFIGYKSGKELYDIVRHARFVCVPSEWYENNPMTIVEAYSMGIPVIGARIGGIPEIIEEGKTGYLFESGDVNSLKTIIERSFSLSNNEHIEMKNHARLFAKKYFNKETYVEQLLNFYKTIINSYNSYK